MQPFMQNPHYGWQIEICGSDNQQKGFVWSTEILKFLHKNAQHLIHGGNYMQTFLLKNSEGKTQR